MMYKLAKALTGKKSVGDINDAWNRYKQCELVSFLALDDDSDVQTTTTVSRHRHPIFTRLLPPA
jgi:hypothetical protein